MGPPGGKCSAHGVHSFKARIGHHLAPQKLSSGRNVFEELGKGFALLSFDGEEPSIAAFTDAARAEKIPLKVIRDSTAEGRTAYESRFVLVRPDQFIAWTGDGAPAEARALLARCVGR
jgi:hypothetical protein